MEFLVKRWLKLRTMVSQHRSRPCHRARPTARLLLEELETRLAPAGPAVIFALTNNPAAMTAGTSGLVTVTALDSTGNVATGYQGAVNLVSSDPLTGSPTTYTFTAADAGVHTFSFTLDTAGSQQLVAYDGAGVYGYSEPITVSPAALDHFAVAAPQYSASYYAFNATVSAKDAYNNTVTGYTGLSLIHI